MKPRVFVSSIIDGFGAYRHAVRIGVETVHGEPVLVEDLPSMDVSPRTACLDVLATCDIVIVVVGLRGGWRAPSGKLVVEEEFDEARLLGKRTAVFVQEGERDKQADELAAKVSGYVDGRFRLTFETPGELQAAVERTLPDILARIALTPANPDMRDEFAHPYSIQNEAMLRLVLKPERQAQLIDPVTLEDTTLHRKILEVGHAGDQPLFSYEKAKKRHIGVNEIVILQQDDDWRNGREEVRLEIRSDGTTILDTNVSGREHQDHRNMMSNLRVVDSDVKLLVGNGLRFASGLYDALDPYMRFDQFHFNVALSGLGYRTFGPRISPSRGQGIPMGDHGDAAVIAFESPRVVTRAELANPDQVSAGALALIRRRLSKGRGADGLG